MARTTRILRSPGTPQASVRVAYASLWLRATTMARLGTPYYRAMREENSCQCQVCLTRTKRIGCRDCAIHRYTDADGCLGHEIATKGPFIATQLDVELSWVELSCVATDTLTDAIQLSPTIGNATDPAYSQSARSRSVELCWVASASL